MEEVIGVDVPEKRDILPAMKELGIEEYPKEDGEAENKEEGEEGGEKARTALDADKLTDLFKKNSDKPIRLMCTIIARICVYIYIFLFTKPTYCYSTTTPIVRYLFF